MRILVLNPGSVTLKATVLDLPATTPRFDSTTGWIDPGKDAEGHTIRRVAAEIAAAGIDPEGIEAVGYRVVHGGDRFTEAVILDDGVVASIDARADLAPLHNPGAVATIRAARRLFSAVPHVASFDTAFHATLPESAWRYPVPDRWAAEAGIRRYGFHGLSVAWSTARTAKLLRRDVTDLGLVVAHLGGGCSVTAVDGGRSVDTSMGMTPLEGVMMGTRAGSIDPGILFRLLREGWTAADTEDDLVHGSGLVGVAGTADMVRLLARRADGDRRATLAIEMFVRRAAAGIAAAATSLPRLDALAFTGGIGEHAAAVRDEICDRLSILGVPGGSHAHDDGSGEDAVVASGPRTSVLRIHAREDVVIARDVERLSAGS